MNEQALTTLSPMLDALHHRGPDGRDQYLDRQHGVAMGHTRLAINDLACGRQPLHSHDRRYVLTANGEFYNFKRFRALAMAEGRRYATKTDSEIALTLFDKHGLDFVHHLRGEFALAFYDSRERQMILVRDRFGVRPLFFHLQDDLLVYASEIKSLIRHPEVPARISPQAALHQLMQTIVPGTCAFENIVALQPGQMMIVKNRGDRLHTTTHQYWDMNFPAHEEGHDLAPPQELVERVREKLVESIVLRLEADVPVGCYLSGGIDSCCILGLATGAMQSPVKAFTISFDHADYDESAIAEKMAQSMQADQEIIHLKAAELYGDNYVNTVWHAERTFYNTLGVAKNLMSRRVRECGYKTVITGEGSDELFGGYPAFKRDMFLHGLADEPEQVRRSYQKALDESNRLFKGAILAEEQLSHPAFERLCGFTPSWIQPWMATLELARPLMHRDLLPVLKDYDPIEAIAGAMNPKAVADRHPLDKAQYTWSKTQLEGQILNWGGDRVDMANSMESRPAFLDHHMAELAVKIPPRYRIRGNIEKWVLREAVKGVLPEVLYQREKFAFMAPPAHTDESKQAKLDMLLKDHLNPSRIEEAGLLDSKAVQAFIKGYQVDRDPVSLTRKDALLNHLLCLQILHHQFVEGNAP